MDIWDDAYDSLTREQQESDRERAQQRKEDEHEPLMKKLMPDYEKYFNDEGEDVRELAAKAEFMRDAIREDETIAKYYWDAKHGMI